MAPKRMTANPIAPLRYRAGKPLPPNNVQSSSESESDSDSDGPSATSQKKAPSRPPPPQASSFPKLGGDLAARQKAAADARAKELAAQASRQGDEEGFVTASESEEDQRGSEEASDESDEEDYDSESSADKPRFTAPTFISKSKRAQNGTSQPKALQDHRDGGADRERDKQRAEADEKQQQQAKADEMLQAQIERTARERAEGRRDWDDEDAGASGDVDDRDGLDPEAEHAAWRLRELTRVQRERSAIEAAERERGEVERRRNLTAEERAREDDEHIGRQREERENRAKMGFMQKYFHKGAFFQEDDDGDDAEGAREAKARDVMGARFVDDAANRELLPEYMQIRDMTKLGRKGRTRYKDLRSEDTGRFGADLNPRRGGRYDDGGGGGAAGPSGANGVAVGERRRREDDRDRGDEKRPRYDR